MELLPMMTILILSGTSADCYKILIVHPTPSISHQIPAMTLTEALIKKGHELYVISTDVIPGLEKNYTHVDLSFSYKYFQSNKESDETINLQKQHSKFDILTVFIPFTNVMNRQLMSEPVQQFQRQVKENNISFDVIIGESIFMSHISSLAEYLAKGTPLIGFATITADVMTENGIGGIYHYSFTPSLMDPYTDRMSFWQKLHGCFIGSYLTSLGETILKSAAKKFMEETYGPEYGEVVPSCYRKPSILMLSSNFLYGYPRVLPPNVIELGPMHIKPLQSLPKVLQDWLDGAEKGAIYLSFGSNMKSKSLPEDVRSNLLRFFKELPKGYRVLWKWELDGQIPGQSDNILTHKWLPQQSVLAHPKVKAFMTQGGLQSFQEAVHFGVPTIGVPWFGDQLFNVAKMVDAGIGVRLEPQDLHSYEAIKAAVLSVLLDESYAAKMKKLSAISRDFTSQAVDKAVFWVEHVARHRGAPHLRPSTADSSLFEYFCLDIISVIIVLSFIIFAASYAFFKYLINIVHSKLSCKIKQS